LSGKLPQAPFQMVSTAIFDLQESFCRQRIMPFLNPKIRCIQLDMVFDNSL
jgi:hypothetical protein